MSSPLLPFNVNISTPDGSPYQLKMSQGFNEAIYYGTGLPKDTLLASRIEGMMASCNGHVALADPGDAFVSHLMALSWHLEYLATALLGDNTSMDDHQAFLNSLSNLSSELVNLDQHPVVGPWVKQRLQEAQFRHFQTFGSQETLPAGPVTRPQFSPWNSQPHEHAILMVDELPPMLP